MCNCIEQMNEQLRQHDTELVISIPLNGMEPKVALWTDVTKKRSKAKRVIATFCPFCGQKYDTPSKS